MERVRSLGWSTSGEAYCKRAPARGVGTQLGTCQCLRGMVCRAGRVTGCWALRPCVPPSFLRHGRSGHTNSPGPPSCCRRACCLLGLVRTLFSGGGILALRTGAVLAGCSCSTPSRGVSTSQELKQESRVVQEGYTRCRYADPERRVKTFHVRHVASIIIFSAALHAHSPCCASSLQLEMTMHSYTSLVLFPQTFVLCTFATIFGIASIALASRERVHQPIFLLSKSHCRGDEGSNEVDGHHSQ